MQNKYLTLKTNQIQIINVEKQPSRCNHQQSSSSYVQKFTNSSQLTINYTCYMHTYQNRRYNSKLKINPIEIELASKHNFLSSNLYHLQWFIHTDLSHLSKPHSKISHTSVNCELLRFYIEWLYHTNLFQSRQSAV